MGIEVSPATYDLKLTAGQQKTVSLEVMKATREVAFFEVRPDNFAHWITPTPTSFILEGGGQKNIKLTLRPSQEGHFATQLSVVAWPLKEPQLQVGSGVKIPLKLTVNASSVSSSWWIFLLVALSALPVLIVLGRHLSRSR